MEQIKHLHLVMGGRQSGKTTELLRLVKGLYEKEEVKPTLVLTGFDEEFTINDEWQNFLATLPSYYMYTIKDGVMRPMFVQGGEVTNNISGDFGRHWLIEDEYMVYFLPNMGTVGRLNGYSSPSPERYFKVIPMDTRLQVENIEL